MTDEGPETSDEAALLELGLTLNEARVYLALLSLGEASVGEVTDRVKMHRSTVYDALERLIHKGVASHIVKNDVKLFASCDPEDLLNLLKEKELKIRQILPKLKLEKSLAVKETTSAQVFEGVKAFRIALEKLLECNQPILAYGIPKVAPEILKYFIEDFHRKRIEKKILMKHLYNEDAQERIKYLNSMAYTEAKYLPERFNTPVTTVVCGEVVIIINWEKPITFIHINNKILGDTYRRYFEVIYDAAK